MVQERNNLFILNNLYNVRHLGNFSTKEGLKTRAYKYIRGSAKGSLTPEEKAFLYKLGTRVVVDLRYFEEINKLPSPLYGYEDMTYYHVDMMGEYWQMREQGYNDLSDLYIDLLEDSKDKIKDVFKIFIKHQNEGVYYHCTAGKDRTGVITMLLLDLINVSKDTIINNYSESYENNKERPGYKNMPEKYRKFTLSNPEYITRAINHVYDNYGGSENYLLNIGLTSEDITILKKSILVD